MSAQSRSTEQPPKDTPPEVERLLARLYREMTPAQKMSRVLELNHAVERLAAARLDRQYGPDLSSRELELRLAALRLDRDTMVRVFDWDPDIEGY